MQPTQSSMLLRMAAGTSPRTTTSDIDRKSTRLKSSHGYISYAAFCLQNNTASGRHAPRRRRDAGEIRADLPYLYQRSCPTRRLLSRLQRLAALLLQDCARLTDCPSDA